MADITIIMPSYNKEKYIAGKNIDEVVTVGQEAKAIVKAIKDSNDTKIVTNSFDTNEEAVKYLKESFKDDTCAIIVKGSRGMKTDEIVKELKK